MTPEPHPAIAALRAERRRRGITQAAIADAMQTSVPALSSIETGRKCPNLHTLIRYADALGYDLTITPKENA